MAKKGSTAKVYRSAKTGQYVPTKYGKTHPSTTDRQEVRSTAAGLPETESLKRMGGGVYRRLFVRTG